MHKVESNKPPQFAKIQINKGKNNFYRSRGKFYYVMKENRICRKLYDLINVISQLFLFLLISYLCFKDIGI